MFDIFYKTDDKEIYPIENKSIGADDITIIYWNNHKERLKEFHGLIEHTWDVIELVNGDVLYSVVVGGDTAAVFADEEDAHEYCCELISRDSHHLDLEYKHFPLRMKHGDSIGFLALNFNAEVFSPVCLIEAAKESESEVLKKIAMALEADLLAEMEF